MKKTNSIKSLKDNTDYCRIKKDAKRRSSKANRRAGKVKHESNPG